MSPKWGEDKSIRVLKANSLLSCHDTSPHQHPTKFHTATMTTKVELAQAQAKIDMLNRQAATNCEAFISRRSSAPEVLLSDQTNDLKERLRMIMEEKKAEEANANQIIDRMKSLRSDLNKTLDSCHKTLEVSNMCLTEHFKSVPAKKLAAEIKDRFEHFDKDKSGALDRDEVREAMAEMGTRPTETELDEFYRQCDTDGNGLIDMVEFENMVLVKLGILNLDGLKDKVATTKAQNARISRRASTSATQDPALLKAAEAYASANAGGRFGRRASLPGAVETVFEHPPSPPKSAGTKGSPSGVAKTTPSKTTLPPVSSTEPGKADRPSREPLRATRTPSAGKAADTTRPRGTAARSPEPKAQEGFSRRSSTGKPPAPEAAPRRTTSAGRAPAAAASKGAPLRTTSGSKPSAIKPLSKVQDTVG